MDPQALIESIIEPAYDFDPDQAADYNEWVAKGGYRARVAVHPVTDEFMQGDRYGEVLAVTRTGKVKVILDRSGSVRAFHRTNLIPIP